MWRVAAALAGLLAVPTLAAADLAEAEGAFAQGNLDEAGRLIREYVQQHPEGERSAPVAAMLARTAADPAEALGRWDEVIALDPGGDLAAEAHWAKGMHAYSAGLYVAAAGEFQELAGSFGDRIDAGRAVLWRGYAELGAGEAVAALESFEKARRDARDPADVAAAELGLANATFQVGKVRDAMRRYERFEREHPEDGRASTAAHRAVECLRLLGRTEEATEQAVRIEREYPNSFEATLARAETRQSEAPPPVEEEEEEAEPEPPGPFIVQVASMTELRNAVALRRSIRGLGLGGVRIEMADGASGPVHRVFLGPYDTEDDARAVADSVATLGDLNPRVRVASP